MKTTYRVKVARVVIQTTLIEVEAATDEQASREALRAAEAVPTHEWVQQPLSEGSHLHVQDLTDDEESDLDKFPDEYTEYVLLKANTNIGSGEVIPDRWLAESDPLLIADVCQDWIKELQPVAENALSGWLSGLPQEVAEYTTQELMERLTRKRE